MDAKVPSRNVASNGKVEKQKEKRSRVIKRIRRGGWIKGENREREGEKEETPTTPVKTKINVHASTE